MLISDQYAVSNKRDMAYQRLTSQENVFDQFPIRRIPPVYIRLESDELLTNDQPQKASEPFAHLSNKIQPPPIPFPQRLRKEKEEAQLKKFLENLKHLFINLPFIETLAQMPKYAKFLKGLLTNKARLEEACTVTMNERCSAILLNKLRSKEKDPWSFTIPCDIGQLHINNALADLEASIVLMPYTIGLEKSIDQSDLEDCEPVECNINNDSNKPIRRITSINKPYSVVQEIAEPVKLVREHLYSASANEIDENKLDLKDLPNHLEYAYLHGDKSFPIIISSEFSDKEKSSLLQVLEKRKGAISWKMSDIKGISPSYCTHKILMEDDFKPIIQPQRRLSLKVQDVVKNEIVKLLDSGLIYLISDSSWVSPIHIVPKKGGMTVVLNDNNELIPSSIVTGWRVCIDYHKLNDATQKDYFPLPFIDQMLECLCGNEYYFFLDGFLGFFQIPIAPKDQEKTTFTCPYRTFSYRRMPFVLCNTPATFQRCMTDKRGAENLATDHLSRLENPELSTFTEEEIADEFLDEHLMAGHHSASVTGRIVYKSGFFWPSILKEAKNYVMICASCQRSGNISSRSEIPQNNIQNWSEKLDDALWVFRTAYKTPTECTPFRLVYGKACHLLVEIEHKAYWALKQCNMDLTAATKNRFMELNELMELRDNVYKNTWIYKERTKKWHDSRLRGDKDFKVGDLVLLFNSRFKMHPGKLKSRWYGPNVVKIVYPYGTMEITDKNGVSFKVNG
ncbi:reverse transcriptase domain-containing protein [Tanacetum coccineum]